MEAQRTALIVAWLGLVMACVAPLCAQSQFRHASSNFEVSAPDPGLAQRTAELAEQYRRELSLQWLGRELPTWQERCPIQVELAPQAGGETTFTFTGPPGTAEPSGWSMKIFGSPERVLDSVLPHEVTHTIFATHFGQPLPRWADEGACTTVEHGSERDKIHRLLLQFLTARPSRGLPFNQMFTMRQYPRDPRDMLPLYAQSYSVARYLIQQRGHQHFVRFVEAGLAGEQNGHPLRAWDRATREHYGYEDLSDLQVQWLGWVSAGSQEGVPAASAIAGLDRSGQPMTVLPVGLASQEVLRQSGTTVAGEALSAPTPEGMTAIAARINSLPADSWYRQQLSGAAPAPQSTHRVDSTLPPAPAHADGSGGGPGIWR